MSTGHNLTQRRWVTYTKIRHLTSYSLRTSLLGNLPLPRVSQSEDSRDFHRVAATKHHRAEAIGITIPDGAEKVPPSIFREFRGTSRSGLPLALLLPANCP